MNRLTHIQFHGILGERLERSEYDLDVHSVGEAMRAVEVLSGHVLYKQLFENDLNGIAYQVLINGREFEFQKPVGIDNLEDVYESDLYIRHSKISSIDIIPILIGGKKALQIVSIVLGVALIATGIGAFAIVGASALGGLGTSLAAGAIVAGIGLVAAGISSLLAKPPSFQDFREIDGATGRTSYLFNGPQNLVGEGGPVPLGYGRLIVGSQTIGSSLITDYEYAEPEPEDDPDDEVDIPVQRPTAWNEVFSIRPWYPSSFTDVIHGSLLFYITAKASGERALEDETTETFTEIGPYLVTFVNLQVWGDWAKSIVHPDDTDAVLKDAGPIRQDNDLYQMATVGQFDKWFSRAGKYDWPEGADTIPVWGVGHTTNKIQEDIGGVFCTSWAGTRKSHVTVTFNADRIIDEEALKTPDEEIYVRKFYGAAGGAEVRTVETLHTTISPQSADHTFFIGGAQTQWGNSYDHGAETQTFVDADNIAVIDRNGKYVDGISTGGKACNVIKKVFLNHVGKGGRWVAGGEGFLYVLDATSPTVQAVNAGDLSTTSLSLSPESPNGFSGEYQIHDVFYQHKVGAGFDFFSTAPRTELPAIWIESDGGTTEGFPYKANQVYQVNPNAVISVGLDAGVSAGTLGRGRVLRHYHDGSNWLIDNSFAILEFDGPVYGVAGDHLSNLIHTNNSWIGCYYFIGNFDRVHDGVEHDGFGGMCRVWGNGKVDETFKPIFSPPDGDTLRMNAIYMRQKSTYPTAEYDDMVVGGNFSAVQSNASVSDQGTAGLVRLQLNRISPLSITTYV